MKIAAFGRKSYLCSADLTITNTSGGCTKSPLAGSASGPNEVDGPPLRSVA
jgi:hypothetical protein